MHAATRTWRIRPGDPLLLSDLQERIGRLNDEAIMGHPAGTLRCAAVQLEAVINAYILTEFFVGA